MFRDGCPTLVLPPASALHIETGVPSQETD